MKLPSLGTSNNTSKRARVLETKREQEPNRTFEFGGRGLSFVRGKKGRVEAAPPPARVQTPDVVQAAPSNAMGSGQGDGGTGLGQPSMDQAGGRDDNSKATVKMGTPSPHGGVASSKIGATRVQTRAQPHKDSGVSVQTRAPTQPGPHATVKTRNVRMGRADRQGGFGQSPSGRAGLSGSPHGGVQAGRRGATRSKSNANPQGGFGGGNGSSGSSSGGNPHR